MSISDNLTLYDVLEITSSASPQDVREAYVRTKATYNRGNVALYTLISAEEREEMLQKVEEAYFVLANPERRREYDLHTGVLGNLDSPFLENTLDVAPVTSIDRVPPMETSEESESLLIPPTTHFNHNTTHNTDPGPSSPTHPPTQADDGLPHFAPSGPVVRDPAKEQGAKHRTGMSEISSGGSHRTSLEHRTQLPPIEGDIIREIEVETEWKGSFLKKIREAYKISMEEMAGHTKVSKTYLTAIEEENFPKLPAPVYIRGFVSQIAKLLKLPHEKVATAYLLRYRLKAPSD